jgi:hypothetical protein
MWGWSQDYKRVAIERIQVTQTSICQNPHLWKKQFLAFAYNVKIFIYMIKILKHPCWIEQNLLALWSLVKKHKMTKREEPNLQKKKISFFGELSNLKGRNRAITSFSFWLIHTWHISSEIWECGLWCQIFLSKRNLGLKNYIIDFLEFEAQDKSIHPWGSTWKLVL